MRDIKLFKADINHAPQIVELFTENGANPYHWSVEKWIHYYKDYPEGEPLSIIATLAGKVVAHYGMVPVQVSNNIKGLLGMHAYVSNQMRGLSVLSKLMQYAENIGRDSGYEFICGFANPNFTIIKETIFKWKTLMWLGFKQGLEVNDFYDLDECISFQFSDAWYSWRFGENRDIYISQYDDRIQLLKAKRIECLENIKDKGIIEYWSPGYFFTEQIKEEFTQPFSIKLLSDRLDNDSFMNPNKWKVDMGDSDTFSYISAKL